MTLYGYARVSVRELEDKNLDLQVERLVRHQLHRTPTSTQQARWEAVQQAREQGLSLRAIATNLGMARDTVGKYLKAESPPTKKLSAKEHAKGEALAASSTAAD